MADIKREDKASEVIFTAITKKAKEKIILEFSPYTVFVACEKHQAAELENKLRDWGLEL